MAPTDFGARGGYGRFGFLGRGNFLGPVAFTGSVSAASSGWHLRRCLKRTSLTGEAVRIGKKWNDPDGDIPPSGKFLWTVVTDKWAYCSMLFGL